MRNYILWIALAITSTSCLTGGFNDNEVLDELNAQQALAPKIESVKVNGNEVQRNTLSRRVVEARVGDVLDFNVQLTSGSGAELEELEFFRVYYYGEDFQEDPKPVEDDGLYELSGNAHTFTYSYTVPEEDDDGFHFDPGYTIQVYFRVKNSLDNFGYRSIEIRIVE